MLVSGLIAAGSAGAVTITSWIGGKGATPAIVTAGDGACPGTMTTINGTGFVSDGGQPSVTIGGVAASEVIVGSDIILYARVGAGAQDGSVVVTTPRGSATATTKVDVVPCQSSGAAALKPAIEVVAPQKAKGGKKIRIFGSGFVGTKSVKVGGLTAAYAIPTDNLMYIIVPKDAKAGQLAIEITNTLGTAKSFVIKTG
jgi:hypothetical protein